MIRVADNHPASGWTGALGSAEAPLAVPAASEVDLPSTLVMMSPLALAGVFPDGI
jgi:hypothetical protein